MNDKLLQAIEEGSFDFSLMKEGKEYENTIDVKYIKLKIQENKDVLTDSVIKEISDTLILSPDNKEVLKTIDVYIDVLKSGDSEIISKFRNMLMVIQEEISGKSA